MRRYRRVLPRVEIGPETNVAKEGVREWNGGNVRKWLASRIVASRSDQIVAERAGRDRQDDCDKASAEEMVCTLMKAMSSIDDQDAFTGDLRALLDRDGHVWRGVFDDTRFDRHVRTYVKKLIRMVKSNDGFGNIAHYQ